MASVTAFADEKLATGLSVLLDGKTVSVGSATYVMDGHSLVPYRSFDGQLGAEIVWDAASQMRIIAGTTYGPVRFLAELFGCKVGFDSQSKMVSIQSSASPGFSVYGVTDGQVLNSDSVKVAVAVFNHQLAGFRKETAPAARHGHVHLWMDGDPSDPKSAYKMSAGKRCRSTIFNPESIR